MQSVEQEISDLQSRVHSLENLVLSHIVATAFDTEDDAKGTLDLATLQADALAKSDRTTAYYLNRLIKDLRIALDQLPLDE